MLVGADVANRGRKPPATCPCSPAPNTRDATGPNPQSTQGAKDPASGIELTSTAIEACAACLPGRKTRHPSSLPAQRALNTLDRAHSDHCGPMTPQSLAGAKYDISFRDDATSWMELEPIENKSVGFCSIMMYTPQCEAMHAVKIKAFRSDNGGEFTSHVFEELLASSG